MRAIQLLLSSAAMSGCLSWTSVIPRRAFYTIPCRKLHLRPCIEARALSQAQEWVGLPAYRTSALNDLRVWGKRGPQSARDEFEDIASAVAKKSNVAIDVFRLHWEKLLRLEARVEEELRGASLAEWGAIVLGTADPVEKAVLTHHAYSLWCNGELPLGVAEAPDAPARPEKPELVRRSHFPASTSLWNAAIVKSFVDSVPKCKYYSLNVDSKGFVYALSQMSFLGLECGVGIDGVLI